MRWTERGRQRQRERGGEARDRESEAERERETERGCKRGRGDKGRKRGKVERQLGVHGVLHAGWRKR